MPSRAAPASALRRHPAPPRRGARSWRRTLGCLLAGAALVLLPALAAHAQSAGPPSGGASAAPPDVITDIQFEGAERTSQGELLANLASRIGDPLKADLVTRDVKTLYSLGFFQHVRAEAEQVPGGVILRFVVREKPRIVAVVLRGNTQVSDEKLFKEMTVQVGSFYTKSLVAENADKIRSVYRNDGYLKVKVTPEVQPLDDHSDRLVFDIEESPRLYITDIRVKGTHHFDALEVQRMMRSAEVDCFDWINESGVFDEEKINQDLQIIVARYLEQGYIRVFIAKPKVTLIHNREFSRIIVELDITEGNQYFTGKLDVTGDILGDKQRLLDAMGLKTGAVYNALQQNRDTFALRELYQEQGYAFAQVRPDIQIHDDTRTVDVTYQMVRGDKAYIGRIQFQGNKETRDFVLRREFQVQENELYNGRKLRISQQNLTALGYFAPGLQVDTEPRDVDNVLDVVTKLEETQTGTLQAQLGYSDQSGITVATSVSKGNFLGRGQTLRASVQWSQRGVRQDISSDFIEPHLFDTDYSTDTSVAYRTIEDQTELDRGTFTEVFGSQGIGHPIIGPLRINFALSLLNRTFNDVDVPAVKLRTFTTSFIYNTVNHPIFPSAGSNITLSLAQIGGEVLGGTTEYRRYRVRAQRFVSLNDADTVIAMGRVRLGWLEKVGDNVIPSEERFRLGGITSLRGYTFNEVGGPYGRLERNLNSTRRVVLDDQGQPVLDDQGRPVFQDVDVRTLGLGESTLERLQGGGISERLLNLELLFPLAGSAFRGVVFYDAGQVNAEKEQYDILGQKEPGFFSLLQSVGAGIRMVTPLGVFRFEYGVKLKVREGESPDQFDFTISTLF